MIKENELLEIIEIPGEVERSRDEDYLVIQNIGLSLIIVEE
jgi:hypothetical protein